MADLTGACYDADGGFRMSSGEWSDWLNDPADDPSRDGVVAMSVDGRALAGAFCMVPENPATVRRVFRWIGVHPQVRSRTLDDALVQWWVERARARIAASDDDLPAMLFASVYDWMAESRDVLTAAGFRPVRWDREMGRSLVGDLPTVDCDIEIVAYEQSLAEAARSVFNEAFAGQSQPVSDETWLRYYVGGDAFRPDLTFLATVGGDVVAVLLADVYPHDFDDKGRTEAWIGGLGTRPGHRGRGIASAMICHALAAFKEAGFEYAVLGADANNPTGAFELYDRLGFVAERSSTQYAMPVFAPFERPGQEEDLPGEIRLEEGDLAAISRRGDVRRAAGDLEGAASDFDAVLSATDEPALLATTMLRKAVNEHHRSRILEADQLFDTVLRVLPPGDDLVSFAWQHLGKLRTECGRFASARACFEEADRLRLDRPDLAASTRSALRALRILEDRYGAA